MRVFNTYIKPLTLVLLTADVIFALMVSATYQRGFKFWAVWPISPQVWLAPIWLSGCLLLPTFAMGLYQRSFLTVGNFPSRALAAFLLGLGLVAIYARLNPAQGPSGRDAFLVATLCFFGLIANRVAAMRLARLRSMTRRVTTLGPFEEMSELRRLQAMVGSPGYSVANHIDVDPSGAIVAKSGSVAKTQAVIVSDSDELLPLATLFKLRFDGARVVRLADFIEQERQMIHPLSPEARRLLLLPGRSHLSRAVKRALDVAIVSAALLFVAPLATAVALAVWLADGRPIIFRQERLGLNGRRFEMLKFRSMRIDAEKDGVARWADMKDPRATKVGAFLRRSRLDEIPQLINVLRGDMSLVGPRPERPEMVERLSEVAPMFRARFLVPPGLSGWAQINFPYGATVAQNLQKAGFDLYYVKNGSVLLDLIIMIQTIRVIIMAEGSR